MIMQLPLPSILDLYRRYLYHAYLTFIEANKFRNPSNMKSFSQALESILLRLVN
ncbi:hypothetical protein HH682_07380 [Rosenbergiella sp. S61]|uniref:DNA primase/nucleoside triphosphatase C-terminal domain-containing protein n=1 Tax=Rosenbergiella gaditana TaxID=2726987 RepID=A0ABS5SYE3_9GAMM|nr:hypothetical protein [Rosenbergiella gaditana]